MSYLHRIVQYSGVYTFFSLFLVVLGAALVAWKINQNIEANLDVPLLRTLGSYAATLDGGTTNSRAMGAAILFGEENQEAKRLVQGKLRSNAPTVKSALDTLRQSYLANAVILTNHFGEIVAYSNKDNVPGSGRDLSFRPYIKLALKGVPNVYPAVGTIDTTRGIFLAAPVRAKSDRNAPSIGAVVIKIGADKLDTLLKSWTEGIALLLSPQGVVFATGNDEWLFGSTERIDTAQLDRIKVSRQFGSVFDRSAPNMLPFTLGSTDVRIDGIHHAVRSQSLSWDDPEGDWRLTFLERRDPWWKRLEVLSFSGLAALFLSLALYWIYAVARNTLLLESMNQQLLHNDALLTESQRIAGVGSYTFEISTGRWESSDVLDDLFGINKFYPHTFEGWSDLLHPDDRQRVLDILREKVVGQGRDFDLEFRIIRSNDHVVRWMHGLGRVEMSSSGRPLKLQGTVQDITDTIDVMNMLHHAKNEAEEASRAKSMFLSNMSHEIRTPMNSIIGMTQLAILHEKDARQLDYLKKISLSGEHLLGIIDDLLDFSKIEAGKLTLEEIDFDLFESIQSLQNLTAWKAAEKGLSLNFDVSPELPKYYRGDPLRLKQVLLNFINNAIKFTREGGIIVRARLDASDDKDNLLSFEVQDTGIGITVEQQEKLFQSFQQGDSSTSRTYGGTGLGLAISKRLVEMMGGECGLRSEPGRGSTFWFTVRLGKSLLPSSQTANQSGNVDVGIAKDAIRGKRILLVEDQPLNQMIAQEILVGAGMLVETANNGEEALALLNRDRHFDCVLMDVQMPVMDGLETTRRIRADSALEKLPVLALTANAYDEDRERCFAAGMNDFVSKPFKMNDFYSKIAKWV